MTNIKDWWLGTPIADCIDSKISRGYLLTQIEANFGKAVATKTNLETDVKTFTRWQFEGYRIHSCAKSIQGIRLDEIKNSKGEVVKRIPRPVKLFHRIQTKCVRY